MTPDCATLTILIVDDHPSFHAVARMVLETDGFAVVGTEQDGESGVAGTLRLEPDIVLLDVELPDIDGFEVAARLREAGSPARSSLHRAGIARTSARSWRSPGRAASSRRPISRAKPSAGSSREQRPGYPRSSVTDLVVATPVFLDLTFVGLESLPELGEERFAAELLRSPGGGAITAVAPPGWASARPSPRRSATTSQATSSGMLAEEGVEWIASRSAPRTPTTVIMPFGGDRAMVTIDPGARATASDVAALEPRAVAASLDQLYAVPRIPRSTSRAATTTFVPTRGVRRPRSTARVRCSSTNARPSG